MQFFNYRLTHTFLVKHMYILYPNKCYFAIKIYKHLKQVPHSCQISSLPFYSSWPAWAPGWGRWGGRCPAVGRRKRSGRYWAPPYWWWCPPSWTSVGWFSAPGTWSGTPLPGWSHSRDLAMTPPCVAVKLISLQIIANLCN